MASKPTSVICVKVADLRKGCPCCGVRYDSLEEWLTHPDHLYIGRRNVYVKGTFDSKWRNRFVLRRGMTREQVVDRFEESLLSNRELLSSLHELKGKTLGCWCAPLLCHGHVLRRFVDNPPE